MNLQTIKLLIENSHYPGGVKALAEQVGMTEQNLHRCVRENKIQAQDLEKIAVELQVPVTVFFTNNDERAKTFHFETKARNIFEGNNNQINESGAHDNTNNTGSSNLIREIEDLKKIVADKDSRINVLEELVASKNQIIELLKGLSK